MDRARNEVRRARELLSVGDLEARLEYQAALLELDHAERFLHRVAHHPGGPDPDPQPSATDPAGLP